MNNKKITTEDILNDRTMFTEKQAKKIWGGVRANSGRKAKPKGEVLSFTKRLTEKESRFIDYARAHNINYDDLMQG